MADPVDPTQPPPPVSTVRSGTRGERFLDWSALERCGRARLHSAHRRDHLLHFGEARWIRPILRHSVNHIWRRLVSLQHLLGCDPSHLRQRSRARRFPVCPLGLVAFIVHLAFLIIWIILTIKAFTNVRWEIPYLGPMARKQFDGTTTV